LQKQAIKIHQV